jgi:cytochrome c-type biogenesis protein CcmH
MILWTIFAVLTLAVLAVLLAPLLRAPKATPVRADFDLAVYRAQLAELDTDCARGLIAAGQGDGARLEIQRRMLDAGKSNDATPSDDRNARRTAAIVLAIIIPLGAGFFYAAHGRPDLPGKPYAERLQHDPAVILADAAEQLGKEVAAKPSAQGYRRLSELYLQMRDYEHAAAAAKRAILNGAKDASDWALLGEIFVLSSDGAVGPQALAAFARALELDAREPRARFYAGLAEAQIGNLKAAVAVWRDLEKDSKPDAPWLPPLRRQIADIAKLGKFDPASVPPAPPSPAALTAAVEAMTKAMGAAPK